MAPMDFEVVDEAMDSPSTGWRPKESTVGHGEEVITASLT